MKRRKASLPRVSILAYSRRDLERFSHAVESLTANVLDLERLCKNLEEQVHVLTMKAASRKQSKKPPAEDRQVEDVVDEA